MVDVEPLPMLDTSFLPEHLRDMRVYDRVAQAKPRRILADDFEVPIRQGAAWPVRAGQICRILTPYGPQAGDFNCWNLHNPREHMWAARTRQIQGSHVTTHDRLWSRLPFHRPMLTITDDTVSYGVDKFGGMCHDLLGSRCDPYLRKLLTGEDFDYQCHSNLTRAILPFRLTEADVHDVLNLFTVTAVINDKYCMGRPSPALDGDYFEFMAEIDLLCAVSVCPGGDLAKPRSGPNAEENLEGCRPLQVQVFDQDPQVLANWAPPTSPDYRGQHGLREVDAPWRERDVAEPDG